MAKGKKSFVLYSDQKELFEHLSDEQAGKLIKHIFKYVNDESPETDDPFIKLAFVTIKASLKRDLSKWENQLKQRSEAGKASAEKRKRKSTTVNERTRNSTDSVNDNVSVNVNDNDNKKKKKEVFNFRKSLIDLGVEEQVAEDWMKVRKTKKATNTETSFKQLLTQIEKSGKSANECITMSVENSWKGFKAEWMNNSINNNKTQSNGADHVHVQKKKSAADWVKES